MSGTSGRKRAKKQHGSFSVGELNRLVDDLCHPLFRENSGFILVDGFLHGLVEQDPPVSVKKFVKYNLPKLIEQSRKKTRKKGKENAKHGQK